MIIIDIDMPKHCDECPIKSYDSLDEIERCPITGVMCLNIGRQDNCPLKEIDIDVESFKVLLQMSIATNQKKFEKAVKDLALSVPEGRKSNDT